MENTMSKVMMIIASILLIGVVIFGTVYSSINTKGTDVGQKINSTNVTTPAPSGK